MTHRVDINILFEDLNKHLEKQNVKKALINTKVKRSFAPHTTHRKHCMKTDKIDKNESQFILKQTVASPTQ